METTRVIPAGGQLREALRRGGDGQLAHGVLTPAVDAAIRFQPAAVRLAHHDLGEPAGCRGPRFLGLHGAPAFHTSVREQPAGSTLARGAPDERSRRRDGFTVPIFTPAGRLSTGVQRTGVIPA